MDPDIKYFDSFNTFSSKQKLQQKLDQTSGTGLVWKNSVK